MEKAVPESGDRNRGAASGTVGGSVPALPNIVQLVTEHHAALYRYAFRLTGSAADAEDLVQQGLLLAHQRIGQLREPDRAAGWLMAILRNCFFKNRRRAHVLEPLIEEPIETIEEFPDWVDPEQLQQALNRLPDDVRGILVLFFFEECSYKEIADALEVPIGTVMSRLSRAKAKLKQELVERSRTELVPTSH